MDPLILLAAFAICGAIVFTMLAFYQSSASPRSSLQRRLGNLLSESQPGEATLADFESLKQSKVGKTPFISGLISGRSWTANVAERLERADMKLTVSEFFSLRILFALVGAVLPAFLIGPTAIGIVAMAFAGFVGWLLPSKWLNFAVGRRTRKMEHQLIEALSLMSNSLKSGFGLMQSFELASRQMEHPIATELRRMLYDINVGMATETALQGLAERSGSKDFDIVITAMLIQQSTGGNLAEILDNVAHTMRERQRIKGEIATLTTQQMLTGYIIGGLPFAMAGLFSIISPNYMTPLFHTTLGHIMLMGAGMLEFFGVMVIRKILAIEV